MNFGKLIRSKTIGSYIGLGVLLLSVVSLILYIDYTSTSPILMMPWVIVLLVIAIAGEVALFFFDNDYLPVVIAVLPILALGCFVWTPLATLWSIASKFNGGIIMEGAIPENFGRIVAIIILFVITAAAAVAGCFFNRVKATASADIVKE